MGACGDLRTPLFVWPRTHASRERRWGVSYVARLVDELRPGYSVSAICGPETAVYCAESH